ncbi:MAG: CYTH domain-containing protein [Nitrosomonas sp.]|nr:CYTH domain-containing protein [Nitrosomonas sp.]
MSTEIELKLSFPSQFVDHIKQLPILKEFSIASPVTENLHSTYYDTPDHALGKKRIALRIRKMGDHWIQTIKSGGTAQNGLHHHHEFECRLSVDKPDFDQIPDKNLRQFFSDEQLRKTLKPIFTTEFLRTIYLIEPQENFTIECCVDDGVIKADKKTETISEIELELKSGEKSQLVEFSRLLQAQCPFDLVPENTNKAKHGYTLLSQ